VDGVEITPVLKESIENSIARYQETVYGDLRKYFSVNMFFSGKLPKFLGFDVGPYPTNSGFEVIKVGSVDKYLNDPCVFMQVKAVVLVCCLTFCRAIKCFYSTKTILLYCQRFLSNNALQCLNYSI